MNVEPTAVQVFAENVIIKFHENNNYHLADWQYWKQETRIKLEGRNILLFVKWKCKIRLDRTTFWCVTFRLLVLSPVACNNLILKLNFINLFGWESVFAFINKNFNCNLKLNTAFQLNPLCKSCKANKKIDPNS